MIYSLVPVKCSSGRYDIDRQKRVRIKSRGKEPLYCINVCKLPCRLRPKPQS